MAAELGAAALPVGWRARPVALATLCTVLFLTFLDNTIVSVALASIQTQLHAGVTALQWVVGAYALTFASAMLVFGMVGDQFGRKKVMLGGIAGYCAGSLTSALSPTIGASSAIAILLAGRALMGLGAAASEPGTLSMLRQLYPDARRRNRAIGVWAAVSGFSLALGPVIGGALAGRWGWRGIFWFDVCFGLVALIAAALVLPESADPEAARIDVAGAMFGAAALAALIFAVIDAEGAGFASTQVIALLCLSVVAAAAFAWRERRAAHPLLDPRLLRVPEFVTPNVVTFCAYFATFAVFFFTALYLIEIASYSGYQIAALFLPMTLLMIAASLLAGRWTSVFGLRWSIVPGCLAFGGGLLATDAALSPSPSYLPLAGALALTGLGIGACVVPVTSSVLGAVSPRHSSMAASATNTSREAGAVIGVAILGSLVNGRLHAELASRLTQLKIPLSFQSIVINAIETGGVPGNGHAAGAGGAAGAGEGKLVQEVIQAAYSAFAAGLHAALYLSAGLVLLAGVLALITLRGQPAAGSAVAEAGGSSEFGETVR